MRELNLYQTEEDELHVVKAVLAAGCRMVPDANYVVPEPTVIDSVAAFELARASQRHFFILHEIFQRLPITMRPIRKDGEIMYYVSPSQGGPFLEFMGGGIFKNDETGMESIRSGFLAYRPEYWNEDLTTKLPAPPELAEFYARFSKVIHANSTRIKPDKSVFWLGNDAKGQLLKGLKLGLHEHWLLHAS